MKKAKVVAALLAVFVTMPIWYFLLYSILASIGASELVWFLYWVYLPVSLLTVFILKIVEE